ncbi:MAG: nucleotidyltransferase family protein, partial [Clostridia bacterium]|nr:nucleotidyltransferase family protein [Clostridia bacterium]
ASALPHLPVSNHSVWQSAAAEGEAPVFTDGLSGALLSHLRLNTDGASFAECGGGLYERLTEAARKADSFSSLLSLAATKKYTDSHLRRAILFSYFGVTPDVLKAMPLYTQVLAMDAVGRRLLAHMRKTAGLTVLTKPADIEKFSASAQEQAKRAYRADSVYSLAMPKVKAADLFIRRSPFVLETE